MANFRSRPESPVFLVCGPSGSGKSTLSAALAELLSGAIVISQDNYFIKRFSAYSTRTDDSHEAPSNLAWDAIHFDVEKLQTQHSSAVIVEGHLVATDAVLVAMAVCCVVLRCTQADSRARRMHRRSRTPALELGQYLDDWVWPSFLRYGQPALDALEAHCRHTGVCLCYIDGTDGRTAADYAADVRTAYDEFLHADDELLHPA